MINRIEAIGILVSIGVMALALFLLRVDMSTPAELAEQAGGESQMATPVVVGGDNDADLANALIAATDDRGRVNRLVIDDVVIGSGAEVERGDTVTVHYVGVLQNGQQFDSSYDHGEAFTFTVGDGRVIPGWEEGVLGMQEGGERVLVIPPALAYGESGFGPIPPNATLVFTIELLRIGDE